jgi:hypothetical protein
MNGLCHNLTRKQGFARSLMAVAHVRELEWPLGPALVLTPDAPLKQTVRPEWVYKVEIKF